MAKGIEFAERGEPGITTPATLLDSLSKMAICGLVVPFYVERSRNDVVPSLSGTLLIRGKSQQEVARIVEVLWKRQADSMRF